MITALLGLFGGAGLGLLYGLWAGERRFRQSGVVPPPLPGWRRRVGVVLTLAVLVGSVWAAGSAVVFGACYGRAESAGLVADCSPAAR